MDFFLGCWNSDFQHRPYWNRRFTISYIVHMTVPVNIFSAVLLHAETCGDTTRYLLPDVHDEQLSASSSLPINGVVRFAGYRLHSQSVWIGSTWMARGGWIPATRDQNQFIQVCCLICHRWCPVKCRRLGSLYIY